MNKTAGTHAASEQTELNLNVNTRKKFNRRLARILPSLIALTLGVVVAGCEREEIKVYRVAKESPEPQRSPHAGHGHGQLPEGHPVVGAAGQPKLTWKLPEGWEERPASQMRAASFSVPGNDGQNADVSVIPLPTTGHEVELVNMWRSQMRLAAVGEDEATKLVETVKIGGEEGRLFDMASETPVIADKFKGRMLVAILNRGDTSWFFKMTGEEALVRGQKPAFVGFLKSVEFLKPTASDSASLPPSHPPVGDTSLTSSGGGASAAAEGRPAWKVPAGWQESPGSQFLVAKFNISGEGGAQAAVNVSSSSGDGGGLLANVNRWRQQLGLSAASEGELAGVTSSLKTADGPATLIELSGKDARTGQAARVVGAMVPQAGQTWFYKLMGEPKLVESQKDLFVQFVQSAKY